MNHTQNKLIKSIEKKCTTIMIGALARFEDKFAELWDQEGNPESDKLHDTWQETRHSILNFGNHHIRGAIEDLYRYFLNEENNDAIQYHYNFKVKGDNQL
jgi:hypothetical protein